MSHIIVILDCSGSMAEPFQALRKAGKKKYLPREIKLAAAKSTLMDWLRKSEFDTVTVIPFSSRVKKKWTGSLNKNLSKIQDYVNGQIAGGDTNLQAAISRAIKTATQDTENSYIQYLIVTDGLSQTMEQDIKLVQSIPISQAISGILIDPTPEGQNHLRRLCVRGSFMSVMDANGLANMLEAQGKTYDERIVLNKSVSHLIKRHKVISAKLDKSEKETKNLTTRHKPFEKILSSSMKKHKILEKQEQVIINKIADQNVDPSQITNELQKLERDQGDLEAVVELLEQFEQLLQQLKISINRPRFLAKGYTSTLFIHIFAIDGQIKDLNRKIRKLGGAKRFYNQVPTIGMKAITKLESQQIQFSDGITRKFSAGENILKFTAEPYEHANPGSHQISVQICNEHTGKVYLSQIFDIEIVDFVLGHLSWPSLIQSLGFFGGLVSVVSIICTMLGLINFQMGSLVSLLGAIFVVVGLILFARYYRVIDIIQ